MAETESKPFVCQVCQSSFGRAAHLKRHAKVHINQKHYCCPCGRSFSRSDVLSRHLQKCGLGQEIDLSRTSQKQSRSKRACDQCARAKVKCDGRSPCHRCQRRSFDCLRTREGYQDMYESYSLHQPSPSSLGRTNSTSRSVRSTKSVLDNEGQDYQASPEANPDQGKSPEESATESVPFATSSDLQRSSNFIGGDQQSSLSLLPDTYPFEMNSPSYEMPAMFSLNPTLSFAECLFDQSSAIYPSTHSRIEPSDGGFSLQQLDPVQVKCDEIRYLFRRSEHLKNDNIINTYITRGNLLQFSELYGQNFSRHFPIIHRPTFQITQSPPFLLASIFIVGACFADEQISTNVIIKLAIALLNLIENEDHELKMLSPPLSTVQASTITCSALVCSRDVNACRFISNYLSRNASMTRRAGIFDAAADTRDYSMMTEDTFDWESWIQQESRRRIAAEIISQEMAGCIFQGNAPATGYLESNVLLPSYERCWEATSSFECLRALQSCPRPISLCTAIHRLRTFSPSGNGAHFEASGFGMFVIIKSLHCLLLQAIKYDADFPSGDDNHQHKGVPSLGGNAIFDLTSFLRGDLSGPTVASIADEAVSSRGAPSLKHINKALDSWYSTWHMRLFREFEHEERTFFQNPLPFWWLAKLYIVLHQFRHLIRADSEFAVPRAQDVNGISKLQVQTKIVGWLARFRETTHPTEPLVPYIFTKLVAGGPDYRTQQAIEQEGGQYQRQHMVF